MPPRCTRVPWCSPIPPCSRPVAPPSPSSSRARRCRAHRSSTRRPTPGPRSRRRRCRACITRPRSCCPTAGWPPSAGTPQTRSRCGSRCSRRPICRPGPRGPRSPAASTPSTTATTRRSGPPRPRRSPPPFSSAPVPRPTRVTRTSDSWRSGSPRRAPVSPSRCRPSRTSRRRVGTCSTSSTRTACRRSRSGCTWRAGRPRRPGAISSTASVVCTRSPWPGGPRRRS